MSDKKSVINYLESCSLQELSSLIGEALENRKDVLYEEAGYEKFLRLCHVYREHDDDGVWSGYAFALIAPADIKYYGGEWAELNGDPFFQYGRCSNCDVELHGHAKNALCPICGQDSYLT